MADVAIILDISITEKNNNPKKPIPEKTVNNPLIETYATVPANISAINKIKYNNTFFILIKYQLICLRYHVGH